MKINYLVASSLPQCRCSMEIKESWVLFKQMSVNGFELLVLVMVLNNCRFAPLYCMLLFDNITYICNPFYLHLSRR